MCFPRSSSVTHLLTHTRGNISHIHTFFSPRIYEKLMSKPFRISDLLFPTSFTLKNEMKWIFDLPWKLNFPAAIFLTQEKRFNFPTDSKSETRKMLLTRWKCSRRRKSNLMMATTTISSRLLSCNNSSNIWDKHLCSRLRWRGWNGDRSQLLIIFKPLIKIHVFLYRSEGIHWKIFPVNISFEKTYRHAY